MFIIKFFKNLAKRKDEMNNEENVAEEVVEEVVAEVAEEAAEEAVAEATEEAVEEAAVPFSLSFSTGIETLRSAIAHRNSAWQSADEAEKSLTELKAQVAAAEANLSDVAAVGVDSDANAIQAADGLISLLEEFKASI